jgi:propanol-preferring alcohol dehydrogenase
MKAAVIVEHGKPLQIQEVPVPTPKTGEVLIKLELSGVCHTDVHVQAGDWKVKCPLPMIPGHEGVGQIVSLGEGVTSLKIGDRVCVPWLHGSCGQCEHCWAGWETVCGSQQRTGFTAQGTFAEYCLMDALYVITVPPELASDYAAIISCAGVTVYKGLKESEVKPGQWVVIVGGSGNLGHMAIQYGKAMGMRVIGVDCGPAKKAFMSKLGCEASIDVLSEDLSSTVKTLTGGMGAHGALIIAPVAKAIGDAVKYMRPRGTIVAISLPPGDIKADIFDVVLNAVTIRGSIVGTRLDLSEALNLAAHGEIKCMITKRPFEEIENVLSDLRNGRVEGCLAIEIAKANENNDNI